MGRGSHIKDFEVCGHGAIGCLGELKGSGLGECARDVCRHLKADSRLRPLLLSSSVFSQQQLHLCSTDSAPGT